ncbi:MAG: sulfotransferase family 2 domain-containing protein [Fibrobacterota bacterium]
MPKNNRFFWLHIKKCGGQSFRKAFSEHYTTTDRKKTGNRDIKTLPEKEWNDAVNSYRTKLGEYDFRRTLFVKEMLYTPAEFNSFFKFTIVRNPYARAVSSWKYLCKNELKPLRLIKKMKWLNHDFTFSSFLDGLPELWERKTNRHAATHTAQIWPDITDRSGNLLVDSIIKLEEINKGMEFLSNKIGIKPIHFPIKNRTGNYGDYRRFYGKSEKKKVEELYGIDIINLGYEF